MIYAFLFLLISPIYVRAAAEQIVTKTDPFNVFGVVNSIVAGVSNFATLIDSFKDIFSIVFSGNDSVILTNSSIPIPEDAYMNISQLVSKYGYTLEEHEVTTEDGYRINLHRIPHARDGTRNDLVVFLMHGIIDSSDSWIIQGPGKALGYILADQGFDVWMGNARGNKHALTNLHLKSNQSEFWKFTWEEIGQYDLSAMIDHALNITKKKELYYVGHSQGTTSFYVLNSLKPEYNKKIKMMFSLAPVAWMRHVKSPIVRIFSPAYKILGYLLSNFNTYSPTTVFFNKLATVICSFMPKRCDNILYMIIGNDYRLLNESMLPVVFGHMPSGSSTLQFVHYGQLVESGRFCRYDYGEHQNMVMYGQATPTDYDLKAITVPVALYYSENDWLSDPSDVDLLKYQLANVFDYYLIKDFNHLDYLYASTAKDLIYSRIVRQILDFEKQIF